MTEFCNPCIILKCLKVMYSLIILMANQTQHVVHPRRFEGTMVPSRGQAAFLIFCTCISLASVALVLSITVPDVGDKWYWLSALSPLAGVYYWTKASRKEQIKVKMVVSDDEQSTDIVMQGDDEQIDRLRKELGFMEKGMVYVKGILER